MKDLKKWFFSCINYFLDILMFVDTTEVKIKLIQEK